MRWLVILLLWLPSPALAWGEYAHRVTARMALAGVQPATRAEIARLLKAAPAVGTPDCPIATLEDAAVWPDCVRSRHNDRFGYSAPWHYQNNSICAAGFDAQAGCADGNCVSGAIPRMARQLGNRRLPAAQRLQALAFLVHFIGDLHQPLHSADAGDKGGNDVRASYGAKAPDRMNLHRIWDTEMTEHALTEPPAIGAALGPAQRKAARTAPRSLADKVAIWSREAFEVARRVTYGRLPGGPRCTPGGEPVRTLVIDRAYVAAATPVVRAQVRRAGARIADTLDAVLAPR